MTEITERRQMEKEMIQSAVKLAIAEMPALPACQIEAARITQITNALDKVTTILIGNGTPTTGIVFRLAEIEKAREREEQSPLKKMALQILPNLISTGIVIFVGFLWALEMHLILIP